MLSAVLDRLRSAVLELLCRQVHAELLDLASEHQKQLETRARELDAGGFPLEAQRLRTIIDNGFEVPALPAPRRGRQPKGGEQ